MSTITSPREPSLSGRRIPLLSTPTSSSRPSLETTRSIDGSPVPSSNQILNPLPPKRNRAALREYYNLQNQKATPSALSLQQENAASPTSSTRTSLTSERDYAAETSPASELDSASFNAEEYIKRTLEEKSLAELLQVYKGVLSDVRNLDGERKSLVYDNYSKLIKATETIGRMRESVVSTGQGVGMDSVREKVDGVWGKVEGLREEGKRKVEREIGVGGANGGERERRRRGREVVERVLNAPDRIRGLMREGKVDEARKIWERERALLESWRERGVGGEEVGDVIEDGQRAMKGEDAVVKS